MEIILGPLEAIVFGAVSDFRGSFDSAPYRDAPLRMTGIRDALLTMTAWPGLREPVR